VESDANPASINTAIIPPAQRSTLVENQTSSQACGTNTIAKAQVHDAPKANSEAILPHRLRKLKPITPTIAAEETTAKNQSSQRILALPTRNPKPLRMFSNMCPRLIEM
jgi:hypothetical protein